MVRAMRLMPVKMLSNFVMLISFVDGWCCLGLAVGDGADSEESDDECEKCHVDLLF